MRPGDRSAVQIVAGAIAAERARRCGHEVSYTDAGIMDAAEEAVAALANYNGGEAGTDTVIFADGALGFLDRAHSYYAVDMPKRA